MPCIIHHNQIFANDFDDLRRWVATQPFPEQVSLYLFTRFLKEATPAPRDNLYRRTNSYGLKHIAEGISHALRDSGLRSYEYISNEDLIIALVKGGFIAGNTARPNCRLSPNYYFNLSSTPLRVISERTHGLLQRQPKTEILTAMQDYLRDPFWVSRAIGEREQWLAHELVADDASVKQSTELQS